MKSRAHVKGHPIHPALIPFPFAFLTGAVVFDVIGVTAGAPALWTTGAYLQLAGIGAGLLAAVPGAIDYLYTVPPGSSGKRRATQHAVGNVAGLVLFAVAWWNRGPQLEPGPLTMIVEFVAAALLAYSASLGGTLVTRNLISVDHRYAAAGKWQEATFTTKPGVPLLVGHVDDLKAGQMKLLHVNGHRIVLARTSDGYAAFDDRCTHRGGSLAGGVLIHGTVQCLWHGSQFDARTGRVTCGPARAPVRVYELQETPRGDVLLASPP
jgi:nitrite reductase/ring-hydroxylating ferredoxin subunit/uncharacterized membrane protein